MAIWGEADEIIPVEHGHAALAARPGARLEILPGVGHFAHVEAPNEVADLIDDFMTDHVAFDRRRRSGYAVSRLTSIAT